MGPNASVLIGQGSPLGAWMTGFEEIGGAAQKAVRFLEERLMNLGWPVGQSLGTVAEVQRTLGLGRPASREAITILEARGLVQTRRGPGGGIFVAMPSLEDITQMLLVYLEVSGAPHDCIPQFRHRIWRMIIEAAIDNKIALPSASQASELGFAYDLAEAMHKPAMAFAAHLAELLSTTSGMLPAPRRDRLLNSSLRARDLPRALDRLETLSLAECEPPKTNEEDVAALPLATKGKPANTLAMQLVRELVEKPSRLESEWETAERLGCTEVLVRQARRILEDHNLVHCRRGSKGAVLTPQASPSSLIRVLAPCLIARGSLSNNREMAYFLTSDAAFLAARRANECETVRAQVDAQVDHEDEFAVPVRCENLLLDLSGNPLLAILVRSLGLANLHVGEAPRWGRGRLDVLEFNRRILGAVRAGNADAAGAFARSKAQFIQSLLHQHSLAA